MTSPTPAEPTEAVEEQLAFDVDDLPGGILGALEAVLMVADEPIPTIALATVLALPTADVESALAELAADYAEQHRGFELRQVGGGWRIYSRHEYADVVGRFVLDGQTARLTQASLETLAVIAYRQPVTRGHGSRRCAGSTSTASSAPCSPAVWSRRWGTTSSRARSCTRPRDTSWSGWGCPAWTSCPPSRPTCRTSTCSTR